MRHLNVRIGEYIGTSPLTKKQVKPKNSSVANHLLFCNHSASYDDFSVLTRENKMFFLLESKKSLLIIRDKPTLKGTLHRHHCTYSKRSSNKILLELSLLNCTPCAPSRLHALPITNTRLRAYAPYAPLFCLVLCCLN